jgi:hypothetical protein
MLCLLFCDSCLFLGDIGGRSKTSLTTAALKSHVGLSVTGLTNTPDSELSDDCLTSNGESSNNWEGSLQALLHFLLSDGCLALPATFGPSVTSSSTTLLSDSDPNSSPLLSMPFSHFLDLLEQGGVALLQGKAQTTITDEQLNLAGKL